MSKFTRLVMSSVAFAMPALSFAATPPTPAQLWQQIQTLQAQHAVMFGSHADASGFQLGSRTVDVYTKDLANALENDAARRAGGIVRVTRYPSGALVVKENYDADKKLTGITAMLKLDGYDPADRNWVMAAYKPSGQVVSYGKVQACIACHAMVTKQDFVFAPPPEQLLPVSEWKAFFPKQDMSPLYLKLLKESPQSIMQ